MAAYNFLRRLNVDMGADVKQAVNAEVTTYRRRYGWTLLFIGVGVIAVSIFTQSSVSAGQSAAATPADVHPEFPAGEGRETVLRLCSQCHSANIILASGQDRVGWENTITKMARLGATEPSKKPTLLALLGTQDELKQYIKPGEWNQVEIIAEGNTLIHIINGHIMAVLVDTDPKFAKAKGVIALEIEGPGNLKIRHRNIWLKQLP